MRHLGVELVDVRDGSCETRLPLRPELLQQHGFAHAGVLAALADHTAGVAAAAGLPEGEEILSIEFKINLLRPASGDALRCVARVLRGGRTVVVAESEVVAPDGKLVAKATVTLAVRASSGYGSRVTR